MENINTKCIHILLVLICCGISLTQHAQSCFNAASIYSVGTGTPQPTIGGVQAIISSDFNGDGFLDVAVADNNSNIYFIQVLLGNSNGTFTSTVNSALSSSIQPKQLVSADFNGDNKPDLAVIQFNNTISILLGTGSGVFTANSIINVGGPLMNIKNADFNLDGRQDIVISRPGSQNDSLSVYLGNGNGSFASVQKFKVGHGQNKVLTDDFNNDGLADVLCLFSGTLATTLLGNGVGGFSPPISYTMAGLNSVQDMICADFNNDGKKDLVISDYASSVKVAMGTGTGSFLPAVIYGAGIQPAALASADFNGDGYFDIAATNFSVNSLTILYGTNSGSFNPATTIISNISKPYSITSNDFDNNGKADIAIGNYAPERISVLLNKTPFFSVLSSTNTICKGANAVITVTGEASNSYSWSTSQTGTNITVSPTVNTVYSVSAAANACVNTKTIAISLALCDVSGLLNAKLNNVISLFPNPFHDFISIHAKMAFHVNIMDVSGKRLLQKHFDEASQLLDFSCLNNGVYFVEIKCDDGEVLNSKVIKQ